jgi:O-antigen/teichoic acid export membrane protein
MPGLEPDAARAAADDAAGDRHVASSTTHRVIRGALILLSTQPVTWASSLLMVIFVPRLLDSRALGEYQLAASLSGVLLAVLSLGLPAVLTRRIAADPASARATISTGLVLQVGLGLLGAALVLALVPAFGLLPISLPLLAVVLLAMVLTQGQNVLNAALTGYQLMGRFAWSNAVTIATSAILAIGFLSLGFGPVGLASAGLLPLVVVTVVVWRRLGIGFDPRGVTRSSLVSLALLGLPFLGWDVLVRLRTEGEALVLGLMLSVETVGWFSAALRVVAIPVFVPTLIVTPLMPALSQIVGQREAFAATVRRAFELTLIVTVGVSAAIFAFAPAVPSVLGWAPEYAPAVPLMQVLVWFFPLLSMGMVFGSSLVALGRERKLLLANLVATVFQYALMLLAIPLTDAWLGNGALGAAGARVASEVVMLVAAQRILPRGIVTLGTWLYAARVLLAGVVLIGAVAALLPLVDLHWTWSPIALGAVGAVGGLAYVAALFALRTVRPSDVRLALGWLTERLRQRTGA